MISERNQAQSVNYWVDLALVGLLALVAVVLATLSVATGPLAVLRVPLGFLLVFFLPGYAIMAALYPVAGEYAPWPAGGRGHAASERGGPSVLERLVLSVGLSVSVVPLVSLCWNFSPWGIALPQVLGSVGVIVVVASIVAAVRRRRVPRADRSGVRLGGVVSVLRVLGPSRGPSGTLNAVLALLILVSVIGVGAAIALPKDGEEYTEMYLLSGDSEAGDLVADDYPENIGTDEPRTLYLGLGNNEGRTTNYTIVVELQAFESSGTPTVTESWEVDRFTTTLPPDTSERYAREIAADESMIGDDRRLMFLLYRGTPPENPTAANAYETVHIWVDVTGS